MRDLWAAGAAGRADCSEIARHQCARARARGGRGPPADLPPRHSTPQPCHSASSALPCTAAVTATEQEAPTCPPSLVLSDKDPRPAHISRSHASVR